MEIPVPDPAHTGSVRSRAHFRLAVMLAAGFVALLWLIFLLGVGFDMPSELSGIRPRQPVGLVGIVFAPLVHAGFGHLVSNSAPLLVVGTAMPFLYPNAALRVLPAVYFGPGVAVWLLGEDHSVHFGASGLVYGLVSYVFFAGLIRRDQRAVAASMLVAFMYGSLAWGVLPAQPGVSWLTHLAAALIGVVMAAALRRLDVLPPKRYSWEGEGESPEAAPASTPPHAVADEAERR